MRKKWIIASLICAVLAIGLEAFLLMTAVQQNDQVAAYVLAKPCETDKVIDNSMLSRIELPPETAKQLQVLSLKDMIGRKATKDLAAGKLLTALDFKVDPVDKPLQTMIIKLNPEQSHCGQLALGEVIDLICYRQGTVERLENLKVEAVSPVASVGNGESMIYLTLAGQAEALETLLLSQQEGVVTIIKKTAVQIP